MSGTAWAHGAEATGGITPRLEVLVPLLALAGLYALGWSRLSQRPLAARRPAFMLIGSLALVVALLSPLDQWADQLFSFHMVQHMLLIAVAAPALLLADPFPAVVWALPRTWRLAGRRVIVRGSAFGRAWRAVTGTTAAWIVFAGVLWGWHLPAAYDGALSHRWLHDLEHLCFFAAALSFWWPVIHPAPRFRRAPPYPTRVVYLVLGAFQTAALGLSITLAPTILYRSYTAAGALEDQTRGGVVMWALGGAVDMLAVLVLVYATLGSDSRTAPTVDADEVYRN